LAGSPELAFKAYEIEELVDVYFYRRLGVIAAHAARAIQLTPNAVSVLAGVAGAIGGALLYHDGLAIWGWLLLVLHGVFDSADGQLARLTHRTSELGRILDGVAGYVAHVAIFVALALRAIDHGAGPEVWVWTLLAGVSVAVHAQLYEYHRMSFLRFAIQGVVPPSGGTAARAADDRTRAVSASPLTTALYRAAQAYESMQSRLSGIHPRVEALLAARALDGHVTAEDRARYRSTFYRPVRGWNALGDNVRRYAIGVLAITRQLDWFVPFILGPMNLVLAGLFMWQWRRDRRFLADD
jgi:phosphatidylglycerophosphate synthase